MTQPLFSFSQELIFEPTEQQKGSLDVNALLKQDTAAGCGQTTQLYQEKQPDAGATGGRIRPANLQHGTIQQNKTLANADTCGDSPPTPLCVSTGEACDVFAVFQTGSFVMVQTWQLLLWSKE